MFEPWEATPRARRHGTPPDLCHTMSRRPGRRSRGPPRSRGVGLLLPQLLQESLGRRPMGLRGIVGLAAGDHIALDAAPAARERHHMIHGQGIGGKGALAVRTDPFRKTLTPPLRLAERLRFPFFSGNVPRLFGHVNPISHGTSCVSSCDGWRLYNDGCRVIQDSFPYLTKIRTLFHGTKRADLPCSGLRSTSSSRPSKPPKP
jgi:hypothetical protein